MTCNEPFKPKKKDAEALKRDELIKMLSEVSKKLYGGITAQRFRSKETDSNFLAFARAFSQITTALNATLKDSELQELEERIAALENPKERVYGDDNT